MWNHSNISIFKKSCLVSMMAACITPVFAMQQLSEDALSETTGEGVALVLDDFKMVFQGPNDLSTGSSYARGIADPSQADTGFIRIIPTGENYSQLGERVYKSTYDLAYSNAFLEAKAVTNYATLYDRTYDSVFATEYTRLERKYTENIQAEETAKRPALRADLVEYYYNTELMKRYYDQRYDDYYDGAGNPSPGINYDVINDGTTVVSMSFWLPNQSKAAAEKNTREMIELLYGNRSGETIPNSPFLQSTSFPTSGRTNSIDSQITAYIQLQIDQRTSAGKAQAITEADQLAASAAERDRAALYEQIVAEATRVAKEQAANGRVAQLKTKADVFIYGLALSKSDSNLNTRFSNVGFNWGDADNPWLIHAGTETNIKQFDNNAKDVGYIAIEAPLMAVNKTEADNNIKLGMWMDVFSRALNSSNQVNPVTGGPTSGLDINERLRLQVVANGLSLNGSQVRLFQTLGPDPLATIDPNNKELVELYKNKHYFQTLGMTSLIRLNTDDSPENLESTSTNLDGKGIRISTAARDNASDGNGPTPALNGSLAPIFNEFEGLYLYSPNINLVLGNMYQPFIVGSEGNNIILEVTRIPNIPSIYNQIYQNYRVYNKDGTPAVNADGTAKWLGSTAMQGSTCNVYQCGATIVSGNTSYQGRNATHTSLTIGSAERIPDSNQLRGIHNEKATGIMFKDASGNSKNFGSAVIDGVLIQHLKIKTTGL